MTHETLFISTEYLRDNTAIDGNVDSSLLENSVITAQNLNIEALLGTALFNAVIDKINNSTVDGNYKILLDKYIQPCVAQWAFFYAIPTIQYSVNNIGISTKSSDNVSAVGIEEMQYLRQSVRDISEYLSQRITDYLKANSSLFTEYGNPGNGVDDIKPTRSSYFSGIVFDDNNNDCAWGEGEYYTPLN